MDISETRLAFVREKMGVPNTILVRGDESDLKALAEFTNGQMADVVIDATGNNKSMVRAMEFASFAGRVVYVGITQQNLEFPHAPFLHRRELTLMASRNAPTRDFTRIISLIEDGRIDNEADNTKRLIRAAQNPYVHMLGHLTGRLLLERSSVRWIFYAYR